MYTLHTYVHITHTHMYTQTHVHTVHMWVQYIHTTHKQTLTHMHAHMTFILHAHGLTAIFGSLGITGASTVLAAAADFDFPFGLAEAGLLPPLAAAYIKQQIITR